MKKILLLFTAFLFITCNTTKNITGAATKQQSTHIQYKDDFRSVPEKQKTEFLKNLNATAENYSVLIFTKGYKGENITVSNNTKTLYTGTTISNLKTGIAHKLRIDNTLDTKIQDKFNKAETIIDSDKAKNYKFIYLMKDNANKNNPFTITYSNTLRPLG